MSDADTEAQPTNPSRVQEHFMDLLQNQTGAEIVPRIDAIEILDSVTASLPGQAVQVNRVCNTKVLKRAQQPAV